MRFPWHQCRPVACPRPRTQCRHASQAPAADTARPFHRPGSGGRL